MAELFEDLPEGGPGKERPLGRARLRVPVRDDVRLQVFDLDSLIDEDHPVRVIWAYAAKVDMSAFEATVRAREGTAGAPQTSPHLLLALWLYATSDGIGSARALARACGSVSAYRWLCGEVGVNHRILSEFRNDQGGRIERLLCEHVASLSAAGLIDLDEVAQDGVRIRASAGAASFRRRKTLESELAKAKALLERLSGQDDDDDPPSGRRQRAARERAERVEQALVALGEIEKLRQKREKTHASQTRRQKEPRASTTDPEARVMKMADGGFRPAYNCQLGTVAKGQIVVDLDVDTSGSDRGLLRPMLENVHQRYDHWPHRYLADGGFLKNEDTEWAAGHGVDVYAPATESKHKTDPYAPRPDDGPGVAAWRLRMASEQGKELYKRRAMHECINARARQWGLRQFTVRGVEKVKTVLLWFALANNILAAPRLKAATP